MKKLRILIIENDRDEQKFVEHGFRASGLFDITAMLDSGEDLMDALRSGPAPPDLIMSDLNMPGKNGFDILREIKTIPELKHIPVVITSNCYTNTILDECKSLGAHLCKEKPQSFTDYETFAKTLYNEMQP